jgi:D-alanyl-D-alanine carboxypeptidase/D-alanyl-D-alanine-endopeptidase (penicillin-binding protein 4)
MATVAVMRRYLGALVVALVMVIAGVAVARVVTADSAPPDRARRTHRPQPPSTVAAADPAPAPTPPPPTTTPPCVPAPGFAQPALPAPPDLAAALTAFVTDPRVAPHSAGVSVWIDGHGEVLAHEPDRPLAPASNQKLFTAMGALTVLGPDARLTTELRLTPAGDLVVEGGGDATLTSAGPHSLDALADQVGASGVTVVGGSLLVDESRHDGLRRAPGWQDWQIPAYTGPLSAFMVNDNRWRRDDAFLVDPALANAERLRELLAERGVTIAGPTGYTASVDGQVVATLESATVAELVTTMLRASDNQIADLLLKEIGAAAGDGSLAGGAAATHAALAPLCLPLTGATDDGSGLSRANTRSAREWRSLVLAAGTAPWWPHLHDALPVAGRTGTLAGRFRGTPADGNVRAKTGTIIGGTALTGVGTTAGGRAFAFSAIVNGPGAEGAAGAVDTLVAAITAHPG